MKKITIASGSRHTIPPLKNSPGVPRIIQKLTEEAIKNSTFQVVSKYDVSLEKTDYDTQKYVHPKPTWRTKIFTKFLEALPYRIRKKKYGFSQVDRIVYYTGIKKIIQKTKPNIVVTFMHIELFKMLQKVHPKAKHIFFFRSTDLKGRIGLKNIEFLKQHASGFLANTQAPILELKSYGFTKPTQTIYNAVPTEMRSEDQLLTVRNEFRAMYKLLKTDFVIGYAGRFSEEKQLLELLHVVKKLKENGQIVKVLFAGDIKNEKTPNMPYYNTMIQYCETHLQDQVFFTGWMTNSELYKFYNAIDVAVLLSKYREGNSMFLIESLSYGKPAITTAIGGNKEIITNGSNGYLIANETLETELFAALKTLMSDKKIHATISKNARTYITENHEETRMIAGFQSYLQNFI